MSAPSLANYILKRPWLHRMVQPVANWYANAAGYRQYGLRADDLITEENELVLNAMKRLSPKESYDRVYRIRRATQLSMQHKVLPRSEWTKPEEDVPYLMPLVEQLEAEQREKADLDTMEVVKSH